MTHGRLIAVDGKVMRGSTTDKEKRNALTMVGAYCVENKQALGQICTSRESNEITAIPILLDLLCLEGSLVTIDAAGLQTKIVNKIVHKGGDYLIPIKKNQGRLHEEVSSSWPVKRLLELGSEDIDTYATANEGHGREESRSYFVVKNPEENWQIMEEWKASKRICVSINTSCQKGEVGSEVTVKYYLTSAELTAEEFGKAARMHWEIESSHWCLDTAFNEDASKIHEDNAVENMGIMRRAAMNLLKRDDSIKASLARKLKLAALDEMYLVLYPLIN